MRALLVFLCLSLSAAVFAAGEQWRLRVSPKGGKSTVQGAHRSMWAGLHNGGSGSTSSNKTVVRNMMWLAEVRYRGDDVPEKLELEVFYIGYRNNDMKPQILEDEKLAVKLDDKGKLSQELESPTTRLTRTRTVSSHGGGGFRSVRSRTSGERMAGCVVRLLGDGKLLRAVATDSRWQKASEAEKFSQEELDRKPEKGLK